MIWFEKDLARILSQVKKTFDANTSEDEILSKALDLKYGTYNNATDIRSITKKTFQETIKKLLPHPLNDLSTKEIIICGTTIHELLLLELPIVTVLDLSRKVINNIEKAYLPGVSTLKQNINQLPYKNNSKDVYISLRAIQSHTVILDQALEESIRVVKSGGHVIYSIPNGYLIDGHIKPGLYDPSRKKFNTKLPFELSKHIVQKLRNKNLKPKTDIIPSEILISAQLIV